MENKFELRYVVILNDGVNEYEAEAGFNNAAAAITYADKLASCKTPFDSNDSIFVALSASVAHYEVIDTSNSDDAWDTKYETQSFYND